MKRYAALEVTTPNIDRLLADVDDFSPTAIDERGEIVRVFFGSASDRDKAQRALASRFAVTATEVSDEDWARRSQENLGPVTVGRITVFPNRESLRSNPESRSTNPDTISIVIAPSMGFGTGHHVTTRLCLAALQTLNLTGRSMLDVGTGSGVLAIAADRLGAARAVGIDSDADAVQTARENLALNPDVRHVEFDVADLRAITLPPADVVTANLTGALLVRAAGDLLRTVRAGGVLIVSGVLAVERDEVVDAVAGPAEAGHYIHPVEWEREEDGWVGLVVKKP